jgi:hypothetical protein
MKVTGSGVGDSNSSLTYQASLALFLRHNVVFKRIIAVGNLGFQVIWSVDNLVLPPFELVSVPLFLLELVSRDLRLK